LQPLQFEEGTTCLVREDTHLLRTLQDKVASLCQFDLPANLPEQRRPQLLFEGTDVFASSSLAARE
jgi:hypothetical protein